MRYGSVCSGVEAATLAWHPLGWQPVFFAEVEPFPCAVLQQRFDATKPLRPLDPAEAVDDKDRAMRESWLKQINKLPNTGTIPNLGDFTKITKDDYDGDIDLLVGGTPCQDLSVAGKRAGFDGHRSSLALDFVRLAYELGAKWFVWENVPGVFSSNGGGDFAALLSLFCGREIGIPKQGFARAGFVCPDRADRFGLAWRVLDAQYTRTPLFPFAVPQRRRRCFIVGCLGHWERAAEVLLDPKGVSWNPPQRFRARERVAGGVGKSTETASANGGAFGQRMVERVAGAVTTHESSVRGDTKLIFTIDAERSNSMKSANPNSGIHEADVAKTLDATVPTPQKAQGGQMIMCFHGSQDPIFNDATANPVNLNQGQENCILDTGVGCGRMDSVNQSRVRLKQPTTRDVQVYGMKELSYQTFCHLEQDKHINHKI